MKVVTICREVPANSKTHNYPIAEFVYEQNKSLEKLGINFEYYLIKSGGYKNYIKQAFDFRLYLKKNNFNYDIIHAHGGHIGSIANLQRKIPVITTYHGSDINYLNNRIFSYLSLLLSRQNIFVSSKMFEKVRRSIDGIIIPCGVDFNIFHPLNKKICRNKLGINIDLKLIVFAGRSEVKIKNYPLALEAIKALKKRVRLIELEGYSRKEVSLWLNAADLLLLTSYSEGSPQIIKEAMACNCPIVSTDVGDVSEVINGTEGCYISSYNPADVAKKIILALNFNNRTNGNDKIKTYDNELIAKEIYQNYKKIALK